VHNVGIFGLYQRYSPYAAGNARLCWWTWLQRFRRPRRLDRRVAGQVGGLPCSLFASRPTRTWAL